MTGLFALVPLETASPSLPPIDPNVAKPGGIALLVTVLLLLALVVLYLSLRKQLRKIRVPYAGEHEEGAPDRGAGSEPEPNEKASRPDSP